MNSKIKELECIAYDFDGVMTDNKVLVLEDGKEAVFCHRGDGLAIAEFRKKGIKQVIISTETNPVVKARAEKLQVDIVYNCKNKDVALREYCEDNKINLENTMFLGNDINDLAVMSIVGMTGAPADAEKIVYEKADWKSTRCGGYGVIRDLYDYFEENI